jgi:hypothetical protein
VELLFHVPLFVAVGCALAFLRRIWGRCVLAPAVLAGCCGRLLRSEPGSGGGSPVKTLKTAASPSTRRALEAPFWKDFRLLADAKLPGAKMAAACLPCESTAAVSPKDFVVFFFLRVFVTGDFS